MLSQHLATVSSCSGLGACWIAYGFLRLVIAVCLVRASGYRYPPCRLVCRQAGPSEQRAAPLGSHR
jgi:hypothetical protein